MAGALSKAPLGPGGSGASPVTGRWAGHANSVLPLVPQGEVLGRERTFWGTFRIRQVGTPTVPCRVRATISGVALSLEMPVASPPQSPCPHNMFQFHAKWTCGNSLIRDIQLPKSQPHVQVGMSCETCPAKRGPPGPVTSKHSRLFLGHRDPELAPRKCQLPQWFGNFHKYKIPATKIPQPRRAQCGWGETTAYATRAGCVQRRQEVWVLPGRYLSGPRPHAKTDSAGIAGSRQRKERTSLPQAPPGGQRHSRCPRWALSVTCQVCGLGTPLVWNQMT